MSDQDRLLRLDDRKPSLRWWWAAAAVASVLVVWVVLNALSGGGFGNNGGGGSDEPRPYEAEGMCRQFVEERLVSPATADFSDESTTPLSGSTFQVTGVVDSQNSFGATIRSQYECTVRHDGGDLWTLTNLDLG